MARLDSIIENQLDRSAAIRSFSREVGYIGLANMTIGNDSYVLNLGGVSFQVTKSVDMVGFTTPENWGASHPIITTLPGHSLKVNDYISVSNDKMWVGAVRGDEVELYSGRADSRPNGTFPIPAGTQIKYYPNTSGAQYVIPLSARTDQEASEGDQDSNIDDWFKQEFSIIRPDLNYIVRPYASGNCVIVSRPHVEGRPAAMSSSFGSMDVQDQFEVQYNTVLEPEAGKPATMRLWRRFSADEETRGIAVFHVPFNIEVIQKMWITQSTDTFRDSSLSIGERTNPDTSVAKDMIIMNAGTWTLTEGYNVTYDIMTEDGKPVYLSANYPSDSSDYQTYWGPDNHQKRPWFPGHEYDGQLGD